MTIISYLVLVPAAYCISYAQTSKNVFDDSLLLFADFSDSATAMSIDSEILNDVYVLVRDASSTVCQEECRCAGNPHLFD